MVANSSPTHFSGVFLFVPYLSTANHFCGSGHCSNSTGPSAAYFSRLVCGTIVGLCLGCGEVSFNKFIDFLFGSVDNTSIFKKMDIGMGSLCLYGLNSTDSFHVTIGIKIVMGQLVHYGFPRDRIIVAICNTRSVLIV